MKVITALLATVVLAGCMPSGYKEFYKPYFGGQHVPHAEYLKPGEEPQVFGTNDFEKDSLILRSRKYIPIGESSFNGGLEDTGNAIAQAKEIGATVILVSSEYTDTQTTTSTLFLPDAQTTYHSGNAYGAYGTASYTGTSTSYGTKAVPITSHQRRFDQTAVYFVKSNQKYRFGINVDDLDPAGRAFFERNTGALVTVVIEDSPAFNSNVLAGDLIVAVDGNPVRNADHVAQIMRGIPLSQKSSVVTVLRKGESKNVRVVFDD